MQEIQNCAFVVSHFSYSKNTDIFFPSFKPANQLLQSVGGKIWKMCINKIRQFLRSDYMNFWGTSIFNRIPCLLESSRGVNSSSTISANLSLVTKRTNWSRNRVSRWVGISLWKSILVFKVQILWEGYKIWKKNLTLNFGTFKIT